MPLPPAARARPRCAALATSTAPRVAHSCLFAQEAENKRAVMAQLDAAASSDEDGAEAEADEDEDDLGAGQGASPARPAASAEVERARQEVQRVAAERRAAIKSAIEREDRKKAEHEARRLIREQAGHTLKPAVKGRGAGDAKADAKRSGGAK